MKESTIWVGIGWVTIVVMSAVAILVLLSAMQPLITGVMEVATVLGH